MEFGTLEREIYIDATPDIVYDVVSSPHHVKQWWSDEATFEPVTGSIGEIRFGDNKTEAFTVMDANPPHHFTFRWIHPTGEPAAPGNSLLVTFELIPTGTGTLLKLTETGFREMGWDLAVAEAAYNEHITGWDHFIPLLNTYINTTFAVRP